VAQSPQSYAGDWVTRFDQAAWGAGILMTVDAVLEFDASDDFRQLIFTFSIAARSLRPRRMFAAAGERGAGSARSLI
jgi:hypothetical protein